MERNYKRINLIYEGEYNLGKWNVKGIEYNEIGNIIYDGLYIGGKRHGKGKVYNKYKELIFEGEDLYIIGKRKEKNIMKEN